MTAAPPPSQFACYTIAQAAERLQCGPDAVRALCRRGALRSVRLGRMIRINEHTQDGRFVVTTWD